MLYSRHYKPRFKSSFWRPSLSFQEYSFFWQKKRTKALQTTVRRKAGRNLDKWAWLKFEIDKKSSSSNLILQTRDFKSQVKINKGKGYQPSEILNIYFRTLPLSVCTWFLQFSSLKYRVWWTWFLVYLKLEFYRLQLAEKSSSN